MTNGETSTIDTDDLEDELAALLAQLNDEELAAFIESALATYGEQVTAAGGRFEKLSAKLAAKGARNPKALAAWIGRKKYGKTKFQEMAARGRRAASTAAAHMRHGQRVTASIPVSGVVASVNADAGTVVVQDDNGELHTISAQSVTTHTDTDPDMSGLTAAALTAAIQEGVTGGFLEAIAFMRDLEQLDARMKTGQ